MCIRRSADHVRCLAATLAAAVPAGVMLSFPAGLFAGSRCGATVAWPPRAASVRQSSTAMREIRQVRRLSFVTLLKIQDRRNVRGPLSYQDENAARKRNDERAAATRLRIRSPSHVGPTRTRRFAIASPRPHDRASPSPVVADSSCCRSLLLSIQFLQRGGTQP